MGNIKSKINPFEKLSKKINFATLGWVFAGNFGVYFLLLEIDIPYSAMRSIWSVDMNYKGTLTNLRRKESN